MIKIENIHKSFGGQKILQGVNLEVPRGSLMVILGQSGQGKSVLLKILIGLIKPDQGRVLIDGVDPTTLRGTEALTLRRRFGFLFQNGALFDSMNVYENVAFPLREQGKLSQKEMDQRVQERLDEVALPKAGLKMPDELSGGMRKRIALARALILKPEIMLYDEPTTGLDPLLSDSIDRLIQSTHQKLKTTSMVVSHDIPAAFKIGDQIAMLHEGKIIEVNPPEDFRNTKNPFIQKFIQGQADQDFIG